MIDLIICPLQEGTVDADKRSHSGISKTCREGKRMFFGNPAIKTAFRIFREEMIQGTAIHHGRRQRNDALILPCKFLHGIRNAGRPGFIALRNLMERLACITVKRPDSMPGSFQITFAWRIASAFLCNHMHNDRPVMFLGDRENPDQIPQIMSIYRAKIFQIEFAKDAGIDHGFPERILNILHPMINNTPKI